MNLNDNMHREQEYQKIDEVDEFRVNWYFLRNFEYSKWRKAFRTEAQQKVLIKNKWIS